MITETNERFSIHIRRDYTCPAESLANLLGRKWVLQIIETLAIQDTRFLELVRQLDGSYTEND